MIFSLKKMHLSISVFFFSSLQKLYKKVEKKVEKKLITGSAQINFFFLSIGKGT